MDRAVRARRDAYHLSRRGPEYGLELGDALIHRYATTRAPGDIDGAVAVLEAAAKRSPDKVTRASVVSGLGRAFVARFQRSESPDRSDLTRAVTRM